MKFTPEPVQNRQKKGICNYHTREMSKECPDCGIKLLRFVTRDNRVENYQTCQNCEQIIKTERATG